MTLYKVDVRRERVDVATVWIDAESKDEAEEGAYELAGDHKYAPWSDEQDDWDLDFTKPPFIPTGVGVWKGGDRGKWVEYA